MKRPGATLHVHLSDEVHRDLVLRAKAAGISQSEYARRILAAKHIPMIALMEAIATYGKEILKEGGSSIEKRTTDTR